MTSQCHQTYSFFLKDPPLDCWGFRDPIASSIFSFLLKFLLDRESSLESDLLLRLRWSSLCFHDNDWVLGVTEASIVTWRLGGWGAAATGSRCCEVAVARECMGSLLSMEGFLCGGFPFLMNWRVLETIMRRLDMIPSTKVAQPENQSLKQVVLMWGLEQ